MSLNNQVAVGQSKVLVATMSTTTAPVAIPSNTYDNVVLVGTLPNVAPAATLPLLANCLIGETVTVSTTATGAVFLTVNQNSAEPTVPTGSLWGGWVANGTVTPGASNVAASGNAASTTARSITLCVDTAVNTGVTYKVWRVVSVN